MILNREQYAKYKNCNCYCNGCPNSFSTHEDWECKQIDNVNETLEHAWNEVDRLKQDKQKLLDALKHSVNVHCCACDKVDGWGDRFKHKNCKSCSVLIHYKIIQEVSNGYSYCD